MNICVCETTFFLIAKLYKYGKTGRGVRSWNGSCAASPTASVGAAHFGANIRPLPPEGTQAFVINCF